MKVEGAYIVGLTGNIASGKSTAAKMFENLDFFHIDADKINRNVLESDKDVQHDVYQLFHTLDRSEIRKIIVENPNLKKQLESILHPKIREKSIELIQAEVKQRVQKPLYVTYEAALLVETNMYEHLQGLILITADESLRKQRLKKRSELTEEEVEHIVHSQMSEARKRQVAQWVIVNNGTLNDLQNQVEETTQKIFQHS